MINLAIHFYQQSLKSILPPKRKSHIEPQCLYMKKKTSDNVCVIKVNKGQNSVQQ